MTRNTPSDSRSLPENIAPRMMDHNKTKLNSRRAKMRPLERGGALLDLSSGIRAEISDSGFSVEPIAILSRCKCFGMASSLSLRGGGIEGEGEHVPLLSQFCVAAFGKTPAISVELTSPTLAGVHSPFAGVLTAKPACSIHNLA